MAEVGRQLPEGWRTEEKTATSQIWTIYREAKVSVASDGNRIRMFINIPIYDRRHEFQMYKIYQLPTGLNKTHAIVYENMPKWIAVSEDGQLFIELDNDKANKCIEEGRACLFQRAIIKRNGPVTCAMKLFLGGKIGSEIIETCNVKSIK